MDTAGWTVTQVGAYTRLLMYEWVNGPIPSDMASLSRIAGISDARTMYKIWSTTVGKKFITNDGNLLYNKRLEEEREKQDKRREIQVQKGLSGAKKRWKDHIAPAIAQAQPNDSSSSSSSSSLKNKDKTLKYIADVKIIIDFYFEKFKEVFGTPPIIQGAKDGSIIKSLLRSIHTDELKSLIEKFFESSDPFIVKSGYTLGVFKSQINKLRIGDTKKLSPGDMWLLAKEEQDRREEDGKKGQAPLQIDHRQDGVNSPKPES